MRKRLGSLEKAPIQKIEQGTTKNSFTFISCGFALLFTYFGLNFGVDFYNFLEENTSDVPSYIKYTDDIIWYIKGVVALIAVVFIINRQ